MCGFHSFAGQLQQYTDGSVTSAIQNGNTEIPTAHFAFFDHIYTRRLTVLNLIQMPFRRFFIREMFGQVWLHEGYLQIQVIFGRWHFCKNRSDRLRFQNFKQEKKGLKYLQVEAGEPS